MAVDRADANGLFAMVCEMLDECGLNGNNMVGIGTDSCNVMAGNKHSLQCLLCQLWPNVIDNPFSNYAVDNAVKDAMKEIPDMMEAFIKKCYNWFCNFSLHLCKYHTLSEIFEADPEQEETAWLENVTMCVQWRRNTKRTITALLLGPRHLLLILISHQKRSHHSN